LTALPADFDRKFWKTVTPNMLVTVFLGALVEFCGDGTANEIGPSAFMRTTIRLGRSPARAR
jgi:hypothetical protein